MSSAPLLVLVAVVCSVYLTLTPEEWQSLAEELASSRAARVYVTGSAMVVLAAGVALFEAQQQVPAAIFAVCGFALMAVAGRAR